MYSMWLGSSGKRETHGVETITPRKRVLSEIAYEEGAASELMKHILWEQWLACEGDADKLYDYCGGIFTPQRLPDLLAQADMLRHAPVCSAQYRFRSTHHVEQSPPHSVLEPDRIGTRITFRGSPVPRDTVTWELFKQVLNPFLDPLTDYTAEKIADCLDERPEEVQAFKGQCGRLADRPAERPISMP